MFEILTNTQRTILGYSATGQSAKEIADETDSTEHTVNTHLKNIKDRVKDHCGKTYKLAELRFLYLCEILGKHSEDIKKIIASTSCIILLITHSVSFDNSEDRRRCRLRYRKNKSEIVTYNIIL